MSVSCPDSAVGDHSPACGTVDDEEEGISQSGKDYTEVSSC